MQDRFRFRAWDKEQKKMFYNAEMTYDYSLVADACEADSFGTVLTDDNMIVMQCTGLYDCNNELIFEKDILKPADEKYEGIFIVQREKNKDYLSICFFDFRESARCFWFINQSELEKVENDKLFNLKKIGNVFENPELLED